MADHGWRPPIRRFSRARSPWLRGGALLGCPAQSLDARVAGATWIAPAQTGSSLKLLGRAG